MLSQYQQLSCTPTEKEATDTPFVLSVPGQLGNLQACTEWTAGTYVVPGQSQFCCLLPNAGVMRTWESWSFCSRQDLGDKGKDPQGTRLYQFYYSQNSFFILQERKWWKKEESWVVEHKDDSSLIQHFLHHTISSYLLLSVKTQSPHVLVTGNCKHL